MTVHSEPNDKVRRAITRGLSELPDVLRALKIARDEIETATAILGGVTRSSSNEAPGRALATLNRALAEIDDATSALTASQHAAEEWANAL